MAKNKAVRTTSRYLNYLIFGLAIKGEKQKQSARPQLT